MNDKADEPSQTEAMAWAKDRLARAVNEVMASGIFDGAVAEARPEWTLPNKIVIGRIRDAGSGSQEYWVIAGELPTDCVSAELCATPREAARHFALKWQIGAEQLLDPESRKAQGLNQDRDWEVASEELAGIAESLYQVVEADKVWG
jgi:hypothetical protein